MASEFNFITLSSVSREKGLQDFASIAHEIRKSYPEDKCIWIGTGQVPEDLENKEEVIFTGFLEERKKLDLLQQENTIFMLCSYYEGFSVPIAEACLQRVPVICYRIPEIESVYEQHIEYVTCFDRNEFGRKCRSVRRNYRYYRKKADDARRYIIERYSESALLQRMDKALEIGSFHSRRKKIL